MFKSSVFDDGRKHHDQAVEQLQAAHAEWSQQWTERFDWINKELQWQNNAVQTFHNVDIMIREYSLVTGNQLDPLGPWTQLSDYYMPSAMQKDHETHKVIRTDHTRLQKKLLAITAGISLVVWWVCYFSHAFCCPVIEQWVFPKSYTLQC